MIILDTHIWVRWVEPEANPLSPAILKRITSADQLAVSVITCWEVAWLQRRGRLQLQPNLNEWLELALSGSGVRCIPVSREVALRAAQLPLPEHHRDPADRLILAT
ncbi:MAG: type II toxin-antitoxin system VapC family toxin [Methylococcaceae bacterium]